MAVAYPVMYGKEGEFVANQLACVNDVLALLSVEVGNVDDQAALNVYACVAFIQINDHPIGVSGELCFISEG